MVSKADFKNLFQSSLKEMLTKKEKQKKDVNPSGKASTQIPQLPLGDNSSPWGDNAVCT
jgi:hypothetical protein